jgi:multisubunit Na+/H+ antiporter MnhC subunit
VIINLQTVVAAAVILLIGVGIYALLVTRNMIKVIVALQILVKGVILSLVLAGNLQSKVFLSQSMALTVIVADTIVAVVGLALAVQVRKSVGSLDLKDLTTLRK